MVNKMSTKTKATFHLDSKGTFHISNYNEAKPFSNFFPGIAGIWGTPMWVFFVNRGQGIASFGIEGKNKAIMEFQPANKAYRLTSLQGFRTFIKIKSGRKDIYWEPFQSFNGLCTHKSKQKMSITSHDLTLEDRNDELGLLVRVQYYTMPEEPYAALVRTVTVKNLKKTKINYEMIDGLPVIVPFGISDDLNKNISRTIEAWVKVQNVDKNAPYYQLKVEVSDKPEVTHIKEGNFYFALDGDSLEQLKPIVEASHVFGQSTDYVSPKQFLSGAFKVPNNQQTSNRTPSALSFISGALIGGDTKSVISLLGYAPDLNHLNNVVRQATTKGFLDKKEKVNKDIIDRIKSYALTKSSSNEFDMYCQTTFLDNILRGGLPVSIKTNDGAVAFNVYSRKHGDLERDYNYFLLSPTFYSQGNGNYRDVNQNRRNDVWFNGDVKDRHLINFLNLSQADGFNPLVVKGTSFRIDDENKADAIIKNLISKGDEEKLKEFLTKNFLPGELLLFIAKENYELLVDEKEFLTRVLESCQIQEMAEHGEGFWTDHWTYNLDLIESYLSVYPDDLKSLLLERKTFQFYHNTHSILPRERRYILTKRGVRQYASVIDDESLKEQSWYDGRLRVKNGQGHVYECNLVAKMLCLIANKVASLDPGGVGVEMEADKPNWCDSLNGLPGLLGSSISETLELKRAALFLLHNIQKLVLDDKFTVTLFEELCDFICGLTNVLNLETGELLYWQKSNDLKEHYRHLVRLGVVGREAELSIADIKNFLLLVIDKTERSMDKAKDSKGNLTTYFTHEVIEFEVLDKSQNETQPFVKPTKFHMNSLPLYLEGYVHALRTEKDKAKTKKLFAQVKNSGIYDKKNKMYKLSESLDKESEEIGRSRIFPPGWLENESIWLHMEYKFFLELIRGGLHEEFYECFEQALVPFQKPSVYGRSVLENSSFIVSSVHTDVDLHGQGFVARLSGSTAEFVHIWLLMNLGPEPFTLSANQELCMAFNPILRASLFTKNKTTFKTPNLKNEWTTIELPKNCYAFQLFERTIVVYHNPKRKDTIGSKKTKIKKIELKHSDRKDVDLIKKSFLPPPYSNEVRNREVERIDVYFE